MLPSSACRCCRLRWLVGVKTLGLGLQDPGRTAEPARKLRQALGPELEQHDKQEEKEGWLLAMGVSVLWSYMDQFGTDRVREFVAVDQPAGVAAVPWMTKEEQADCGANFDVQDLLDLGGAIAGPDGYAAVEAFERSMFSGDTSPEVLAFVLVEIKSTPAYAGVPLLFDHCAHDWRDTLPRVA